MANLGEFIDYKGIRWYKNRTMSNSMNELLTREQAAARLAVGVGTVDWMRHAGKLTTVREPRFDTDHPKRIFLLRQEVEDLIRKREAREAATRRAREAAARSERAESQSMGLAG